MHAAKQDDVVLAATPLDAIARLEGSPAIRRVVLTGSCASDRELVAFLAATYPAVRIDRDA